MLASVKRQMVSHGGGPAVNAAESPGTRNMSARVFLQGQVNGELLPTGVKCFFSSTTGRLNPTTNEKPTSQACAANGATPCE